MKGYKALKIVVRVFKDDVVTMSTGLNAFDDFGSWNESWFEYVGGGSQ